MEKAVVVVLGIRTRYTFDDIDNQIGYETDW